MLFSTNDNVDVVSVAFECFTAVILFMRLGDGSYG
jgi:hypothetical protein